MPLSNPMKESASNKFNETEAANGGGGQEAKIRHVARKLNVFKEHLLGGIFVNFNS